MDEWTQLGFMQFVKAKKQERAHVFRLVTKDPVLLESLCEKWGTRAFTYGGHAMLAPAEDGRPRCKLCEKKWAELNGGAIQA